MKLRQITAVLSIAVATSPYLQRTGRGHEGHAAVPSTGVVVDGDRLLIAPAAVKAIQIETALIKLGDIRNTLRVNAGVELPWSQQAKVTSLASGRVQQVLVRPGQRVKAGEPMALVESLELESFQSELLQTIAEVELLQRLVKQRERLAARGAVSGKLALETKSELQQKLAQREILRHKLRTLGLDQKTIDNVEQSGEAIHSIRVVAPIAGTVEHTTTSPGQLVESTDHLFDVVDLSTMYLVGEVLESDAFQVQEGYNVAVVFAELPEHEFTGSIDLIRMKMDESKRTLQVVVPLDNAAGLLRPGMFGRMAIEVGVAEQEIVCPTSALIETHLGAFVLRREAEGTFSRRPIQVSVRSKDFVAVESGLFPGQQVIVKGTRLLAALFDTAPAPGHDRSAPQSPKTDVILAAKAIVELPTNQEALASALISGRVARIHVNPGQLVASGDVLAEVESQELRDLQLDLVQSASKLLLRQGDVRRLEPLVSSGAALPRDFWQREMEMKTLAHHVRSVERRLSLIGLRGDVIQRLRSGDLSVANSPLTGRVAIRSPVTGRVADVRLMLGEIVHSHDALFEIQDNTSVWVEALILERDASRIETGQDAFVTFVAHPSLRIRGKVVRIAPQLSSTERVLRAWIEVANPDGFLKEGMLARVEIRAPHRSEPVAARTLLSN